MGSNNCTTQGVVLFRIFRIIRPFETGLVERLGKYNRESLV